MMNKKHISIALAVVGVFLVAASVYGWYVSDRVLPRTYMGNLSLGGLTREEAAQRLQESADQLQDNGIRLNIDGAVAVINPEDIQLDLNIAETLDMAFAPGHASSFVGNIWDRVMGLLGSRHLIAPVHMDRSALAMQLDRAIAPVEVAGQDVRLSVKVGTVRLLTDTKPGRVVDRTQALDAVMRSLVALERDPILLYLQDQAPVADVQLAGSAVIGAQKLIVRPLILAHDEVQFYISRDKLASWVTSEYDGPQLKPGLDRVAIAQYVTSIAKAVNVAPEAPIITTQDGKVTGFTPSNTGRVVQEDELVQTMIGTLMARIDADTIEDVLLIPVKNVGSALSGFETGAGITELIGKATTPFTGSPKNRIGNIKNGVKFISGTIIAPGQEFSTLGTLGTIDNTTGYLPELVIKGDRTVPDFGGGLCQVSTTLFRAVMNSSLPVTARRNHSYRVSYYEKDGNGTLIGPGLDATIYEPDLDFKFRNDTATPVLIVGYVVGDKITFELYGTKDGRSSAIDGPHLLTQTPPGPTKYIDTPELGLGVTKQVETPHPGGSAVATYNILYPDGHTASQEFRSYYRPWPAQFLVGTGGMTSPSPSPVPSPSPSVTP